GTALREDNLLLAILLRGPARAFARYVLRSSGASFFCAMSRSAPYLSGVFGGDFDMDLLLATSLWFSCGPPPSSLNLALRLRRSQSMAVESIWNSPCNAGEGS